MARPAAAADAATATASPHGHRRCEDETQTSSDFIREGLVRIMSTGDNEVFYNPVQVFNRDLSIMVIKVFALQQRQEIQRRGEKTAARAQQEGKAAPAPLKFEGLNVLEPLAATGLRSLRYLKELGADVKQAVANDLDPNALLAMKKNEHLNGIPPGKLHATCSEGAQLMYTLSRPGNLQHGTIKKIQSLPAGSSIPSTFDMRPSNFGPSLPPLSLFLTSRTSSRRCAGDDAGVATSEDNGHCAGEAADAGSSTSGGCRDGAADKTQKSPPSLSENPDEGRSNAGETRPEDLPLFFDVVDVDPYGSVAPFLDAAVQAVRPGGLLCLTSTDMPVLCGNSPEVTFYKYGGAALKARYMHEMALRLVLHAANASAAKYKRIVVPLLSCSVDFYVRIFVQVLESAEGCKDLHSQSAIVHQCVNCDSFRILPLGSEVCGTPKEAPEGCESTVMKAKGDGRNGRSAGGSRKRKAALVAEEVKGRCSECQSRLVIGGPFYKGPLYQSAFVQACLDLCDTAKELLPGLTMVTRIKGLLTAVKEELHEVPLYYHLPTMCNRVKLEMIKPSHFKAALVRLGYKVSHFHREPQAIKTDAPATVVFDILRTHAQKHPPKEPEKFSLLQKGISTKDIDMTPMPGVNSQSPNVPKWLPNPTPYWGPKSRASSHSKQNRSGCSPSSQKKPRIDEADCSENPLV
ncbi:putative tRNA (guanine(26)-N(2))-dimethyltransferase [Besnoitia besnoiti]|uniref:tRNA (guanine(26)-N(2))-dimethyltransferase n=1 Tax=Besnoitia besnoiti TaxID=94643 RepID=A0A2A9MEB4_BESBE|nr:putative tRNA (guanine(26)-N(2))-dimethyltransferase [Besnoitia besnoiti]PFH36858.1 putative tRNA (guanine(26)-N(2))-dimethyltransferase [Besnoitia besnoiti]